ncbi:MAG: hypothetical protein MUF24_00550 [Chitinophagaceae bacterium]|jgi:copper chaperone NosL|nr:hypothetical protein [Chitinophagaceae bacterium]
MTQLLTKPVRVIALVSGLLLLPAIFLPLWRIDLIAPQYPEGLYMQIFAGKLGGDVQIINGLNHYIGMRELHVDDFVEFKVLPYIFVFFTIMGACVFWLNKKIAFIGYAASYIFFCIIAMVDFYRWEYDYGHNLNPEAAIQIPGMAYQPPLIGFKQLLNFGAYSFPDIGGYLLTLTAVLLLIGLWLIFKGKGTIKSNN